MCNFLVVELGDNDFGNRIKNAVIDFASRAEHVHNYSTDIIKPFIIEHVIFSDIKESLLEHGRHTDPERTRKYLQDRMKVYWSQKFPCYEDGVPMDHDGGSVIHNVHTKETYTF